MGGFNELKQAVTGLTLEELHQLVDAWFEKRGERREWAVVRFRNVASDPDGGIPAQLDGWHLSLRQAEGSAEVWRQDHPDNHVAVVQLVLKVS